MAYNGIIPAWLVPREIRGVFFNILRRQRDENIANQNRAIIAAIIAANLAPAVVPVIMPAAPPAPAVVPVIMPPVPPAPAVVPVLMPPANNAQQGSNDPNIGCIGIPDDPNIGCVSIA